MTLGFSPPAFVCLMPRTVHHVFFVLPGVHLEGTLVCLFPPVFLRMAPQLNWTKPWDFLATGAIKGFVCGANGANVSGKGIVRSWQSRTSRWRLPHFACPLHGDGGFVALRSILASQLVE